MEFPSRDLELATRQATLESDTPQIVGPQVVLGQGGFADDDAPENALVAVRDQSQWYVADSLHQARELAGKVQGRRSSLEPRPPLELPEGDWALTLRTCWVEPAYLETDASWCNPQDEPADPVANGGAHPGEDAQACTQQRLGQALGCQSCPSQNFAKSLLSELARVAGHSLISLNMSAGTAIKDFKLLLP